MNRILLFLILILAQSTTLKNTTVLKKSTMIAAGSASVTWTHIQDQSGGANCGQASTCKFASNVTSGDLLTIEAECASGTCTASDTLSNTWVCPSAANASGGLIQGCYCLSSNSSGADTITMSGTSFNYPTISEDRRSTGTATYDGANAAGNGSGSSGTATPGSVVTTGSSDLLLVGMNTNASPVTFTVQSGWTAFTNTTTSSFGQFLANQPANTYTPSITFTPTAAWYITVMAFK